MEEEHVVTKAQLVMEKEKAQNELDVNKKGLLSLESQLKNTQECQARKQEAWSKERKELLVSLLTIN